MSHLRDEIFDCVGILSAQLARTYLLLGAVALSTGVLVASLGISSSASNQIRSDLAASILDTVVISAASGVAETNADEESVFPPDAPIRACELPLTIACGMRLDFDEAEAAVQGISGEPSGAVVAFASTSGYLHAAGILPPELSFLLDDEEPLSIAFIGQDAARKLGMPDESDSTQGYQISVAGSWLDIAGYLPDSSSGGDYKSAVVVPYAWGISRIGNDDAARMLVATEPGGGGPVAAALRLQIRPENAESFQVTAVSELKMIRAGVDSELSQYTAGIAALLLVLTMLLIANAMATSIITRTVEIGLRRALGASRFGIARLFILEGVLIGFLGGAGGAALGMCAALVVAQMSDWDYSPALYALAGPVLGFAAGVLASIVPAGLAARVEPSLAMRWD